MTTTATEPEPIRAHGAYGARPVDWRRPMLNLGNHLSGTAPSEAHFGHIPVIGMDGNDQWGDCVFAGTAHIEEAITFYGQGQELVVSTDQALARYSAVTGFDPDAGPPGDNPTDQGAFLADGLSDLRKVGYNGITIDAYGVVDHLNTNLSRQALAQLGPQLIGVGVGQAEEEAFDLGIPWDLQPGQRPADENHAVLWCGYYSNGLYYVYTWGGLQAVTQRWFRGAVYEQWACVSRTWVSKLTGLDPGHVNLHTLGQEFQALTGQPSPF